MLKKSSAELLVIPHCLDTHLVCKIMVEGGEAWTLKRDACQQSTAQHRACYGREPACKDANYVNLSKAAVFPPDF